MIKQSKKQSKKQLIIDLYEDENISFDLIAHRCNCEVSYVRSVIFNYLK